MDREGSAEGHITEIELLGSLAGHLHTYDGVHAEKAGTDRRRPPGLRVSYESVSTYAYLHDGQYMAFRDMRLGPAADPERAAARLAYLLGFAGV